MMRVDRKAEIQNFLFQAQTEAADNNWCEVGYYLQHLPVFATKSSFETADRQVREQVLQLALDVLVNGDFQQKWNIVKLFPLMQNHAIAPSIQLLEDETIDTETKWFIVRFLGDFKEQEVVVCLARLLKNTQESDLIAIAAQSLAKIGDLAVNTLLSLLEIPNYRLVAAKSIAHIRLASVKPALLSLAKDDNPEIRVLAIEALGSFRDRKILPVAIEALKDTNSMVRKEAAIAVGFYADLSEEFNLANNLKPLLYDLNLAVCTQTAISLGRIGSESAIFALNEALQSPNMPLGIKLDIVKALAWSERPLALKYLKEVFQTENELVCQEIIIVLGRINAAELKPIAIAILRDVWHSSSSKQLNFETKKALAMALGELNAVSEKEILEQLANDEMKIVQLYALSSLKKLD